MPTQELCAIAVDLASLNMINNYHKFAHASGDVWARRNIHGINSEVTQKLAFPNEKCLQKDFEKWKKQYNIVKVFENSPNDASCLFFDDIIDLRLPLWVDRVNKSSHIIANRLKEDNAYICDTNCRTSIHSSYRPYLTLGRCKNLKERIKLQHGLHCALYDAFELYLFYKYEHSV